MSQLRGHALTIAVALLAALGVAYATTVEITRDDERADRREQVNALACALDEWLAGTQNVLATRGLEGDPQLSSEITTVRLAALEVGGPCKEIP